MRRITVILAVLCLSFLSASAQKIQFEKSLEAAKRAATERNRLLLIIITSSPPPQVKNYMQGLTDAEVVNTINKNFVVFKIDRKDTASRKIVTDYNIVNFPALIFLDSQGGLLQKDFGSSPVPGKYLGMLSRAIFDSKQTSLAELDRRYNSGYRTKDFLKEYINRRKKVGITQNANLIDEYVNLLQINDLNKFEEILFILEAGPITDSKSFKAAYFNKKLTDSVYKSIAPMRRAAIFNAIINNSMAEAVREKNITKAQSAASFTRALAGSDYAGAQKLYTQKLLQYYKAVKDTGSYFRQAGFYYDQHYMNLSADSIRRLEQKLSDNAKKALSTGATSADSAKIRRDIVQISSSSMYANQLNNAAWDFYALGTTNANHLTKAMLWSKRSIELKPLSAYYDTLAHLLYRLGFYFEAEATQIKAIEIAKTEKKDYKSLQDALLKIKTKAL